MHIAKGCIAEIYFQGRRAARLTCPLALIPAPGQYLLAHAATDSDAPLAQPVFQAGTAPNGFYAAPPLPANWLPGTELTLRGPLGHGFHLPPAARKVALAAFGASSSRLLALLEPALAQKAAIVLLTDAALEGLPAAVEISPLSALPEIAQWADYLALDAPRAAITTIQNILGPNAHTFFSGYTTEILIETPLPCGGIGECGVCAVKTRKRYALACKDGPVFDLKTLFTAR
jgi:dihydroorotate dehydrogenase electron transfer subunit